MIILCIEVAQIDLTGNLAPAYIAVIEFSQPLAQIVKR